MSMALKKLQITAMSPRVTCRSIFAILIAAAMLFAPFAMRSGGAMAAMPSNHHSQAMDKDHCGDQPATGKDHKSTGKSCCAAMCTAIAVVPGSPVEPLGYARSVDRSALVQFGRSFLAKLPTPPPRRA